MESRQRRYAIRLASTMPCCQQLGLGCSSADDSRRAAVTALRSARHDVVWIRTDAPGSNDDAVLEVAVAECRVRITFDRISANSLGDSGSPPSAESCSFAYPATSDRSQIGPGTSPSSSVVAFACGRCHLSHKLVARAAASG